MSDYLYSRAVISTHVFVPAAEVRDLDEARAHCTVISRYDGTKRVKIYREVHGWFGFPLYWWKDWCTVAPVIEDIRIRPTMPGWKMRTKLWDDQKVVYSKFVHACAHGDTGFLIHAKTGWGKTVASLAMMAHSGAPILVVVPRSGLVDQWVDRARTHTDLSAGEIGTIIERKASWKGKALVVALVHSLALDYLPEEFRLRFGQIWLDEAHASSCPETFAPVFQRFPASLRGALTATPDRADGLDQVFRLSLVQRTIVASSGKRMDSKVIVVDYKDRYPREVYGRTTLQKRGSLISVLARDQRRNAVLASLTMQLLTRGRKVVVMSDRTQQLYKIRELIINKHGFSQADIGFYCRSLTKPGSKKAETVPKATRDAALTKQLILATYGMMKLGTDIPALSGLVIATPQSDVEQSRGRIERWKDFLVGKTGPVVIDIRDTEYGAAMGWARRRMQSYRDAGLEVSFLKGSK